MTEKYTGTPQQKEEFAEETAARHGKDSELAKAARVQADEARDRENRRTK